MNEEFRQYWLASVRVSVVGDVNKIVYVGESVLDTNTNFLPLHVLEAVKTNVLALVKDQYTDLKCYCQILSISHIGEMTKSQYEEKE